MGREERCTLILEGCYVVRSNLTKVLQDFPCRNRKESDAVEMKAHLG